MGMNNMLNIKKNKPLSFCFVSTTGQNERPILDPSVRYRCYHPADQLRSLGFFSTVTSFQQFLSSPNLYYDVYVFHRPQRNKNSPHLFDTLITALKKKNKILIADYDDLIFGNEIVAAQSSIVKNGHKSLEEAANIFAHNLDAMLAFDQVITSTRPLADKVKEYNSSAQVVVQSNFIPTSLLNIYSKLAFYTQSRKKGSIGYFAGTKSHDKDILVVLEVLQRVLMENPLFSLLIAGPVAIPKSLSVLPNVIVNPPVNYMRLPSLMQNCETVIAPLEITEFNNCKSRVKFLEAALSGCRLVATPIPDMRDIDSENIFLAETKNEWYSQLSTITADDKLQKMQHENFMWLQKETKVIENLLMMSGVTK